MQLSWHTAEMIETRLVSLFLIAAITSNSVFARNEDETTSYGVDVSFPVFKRVRCLCCCGTRRFFLLLNTYFKLTTCLLDVSFSSLRQDLNQLRMASTQ